MAARNQDKAVAARDAILAAHPMADLEIVPLDLGNLVSVATAAAAITEAHPRIALLVNNAGIMGCPEGRTADGFETQLGTSHLGHFALTAQLLPALEASDGARVVTVTSTARHVGRPVDPGRPLDAGGYGAWKAYGRSKLANQIFAVELHRRLREAGAATASLTAHPGLSNTDLQATSVETSGGDRGQRFFHFLARTTGMAPERGVLPQLRAATDPQARSGELFAPRCGNRGRRCGDRSSVGRSAANTVRTCGRCPSARRASPSTWLRPRLHRVDARPTTGSTVDRFVHLWRRVYDHLAADPVRARYLAQVETSPYGRQLPPESYDASAFVSAALAPDMVVHLVDLPRLVLYDLAFGPAIRLAAAPTDPPLDEGALDRLARACWRAVTRPASGPGGDRRARTTEAAARPAPRRRRSPGS